MKSKMTVKVVERYEGMSKIKFEGFVTMPNLTNTRLAKEDGGVAYGSVGNLKQAAMAAAKRYNCDLTFIDNIKKVAAKKSSKR